MDINSGEDGSRTHDLLTASQVFSNKQTHNKHLKNQT
jgi:hypothetical protein